MTWITTSYDENGIPNGGYDNAAITSYDENGIPNGGYNDAAVAADAPITDPNSNPTDQRLAAGTQTTPSSPSPSFDWGSVLTGGNWDLAKLATKGLTLAAAVEAYNQAKTPTQTGYQGGIPQFTATRAQVATAPAPRPGMGGQRYFTDTQYSLPASGSTVSGLPAAQAAIASQATALGAQNQAAAQQQQARQPIAQTPEQQQVAQNQFYGRVPPTVHAAQGGLMGLAQGGSTNPRYLQGDTDGMADQIPAQIDGHQPAALAHGEFVVPADVVSHLGNGNSDAGADVLYKMMDKIRKARTGTTKQGKEIDPAKFAPGGVAYAAGGAVQHFDVGGVTATPSNTSGLIGTESNLSNWVGPYVTDMLGKGQALSQQPYQAYQGPLTAGDSSLQTQAYGLAGGLQTPSSIGTAANTAGNVATNAGNLNYNPTQATNQFNAPGAYTPTTSNFDASQAQTYMNPYLQKSLDPQLAEARRQSQITQQTNNAQATQAGAFGGGRQAIVSAENQRNLGTNLANITGQGYNTAYQQAQQQFNADQTRTMQQSQFGATQDMTGAQGTAQYGQAAQAQNAQQEQFGANYGLQGLQTQLSAASTQGQLGATQNQTGLANLNAMAGLGATQQATAQAGVAADQAAFNAERDNPYKMVQYQQSLLQGLPLAAQSYNIVTNPYSAAANVITGTASATTP